MKPSLTKWAYALVTLAVMAYAFFTLRGPQGLPALLHKRHLIEQLEKDNAARAREVEQKRHEIEVLGESQAEQELQVRKRLKLVKPGDKVFIFDDQSRRLSPAPQNPQP